MPEDKRKSEGEQRTDSFVGKKPSRLLFLWMHLLVLSLCLTAVLVIVLMYQLMTMPLPTYYAVPDNYFYNQGNTKDTYFLPVSKPSPPFAMTTLDQPMKSLNEITSLAAMVATTSLTFDFYNYYEQLGAIKHRFTSNGWKAFSSSLVKSGLLDAILKKKLSTSAVIIGAPVLLNRGVLNGAYAWRFQMVVLITYESLSEKVTRSQIVTIVFKRIPLVGKDAEIGIAVDSFITSD